MSASLAARSSRAGMHLFAGLLLLALASPGLAQPALQVNDSTGPFELRLRDGDSVPFRLSDTGLYLVRDGQRFAVTQTETLRSEPGYLAVIGRSGLGDVAIGVEAATDDFYVVRVAPSVDGVDAVGLGIALNEVECVAGFGPVADGTLDQRGKRLEFGNAAMEAGDGDGRSSNCLVPFYLSTAGYGFHARTRAPGIIDVGREYPDEIRVEFAARRLEFAVSTGNRPETIFRRFARRGLNAPCDSVGEDLQPGDRFDASIGRLLGAGLAGNSEYEMEVDWTAAGMNADWLARWIQFETFSTLASGVELELDETLASEAGQAVEFYRVLGEELAPLFRALERQQVATGDPVMRPLFWEFPEDTNACRREREYFLGEEVLVAPVQAPLAERDIYLPRGIWIDYWRRDVIIGPANLFGYPAPRDRIPLFMKAGAMIPMTVKSATAGNGGAWSRGALTLDVYPGANRDFDYETESGESVSIKMRTDTRLLTFELEALEAPVILRILSQEPQLVRVDGESLERTETPQSDESWWWYDEERERLYVRVEKTGLVKVNW